MDVCAIPEVSTQCLFNFCFAFHVATAHFIPITNIELPTKARQFRRVNNEFMNSLQAEMEKNPAGSYGALFVVAKGLSNKEEFEIKGQRFLQL